MPLSTRLLAFVVSVPLAIGVTVTGAGTAEADIPSGVPDVISPVQLERAALVAMPAVWRVEVTAQLAGLKTKDGTVITLPPRARTVSREGTAFAVTPDGYLVTATHVVQPTADDLAETAYFQYLAYAGKPHSARIAANWVKDQDKLIHAALSSARNEHDSAGLQTSFSVLLKIRRTGVAAR